MEERQDSQRVPLSPQVIRQGFSNQLKELTLLNRHSPRIFIVYAHSLDEQERAEESAASSIAKQIQGYLNPTIQASCPSRNKHLRLNVYSAFSPQGNGSDPSDECKSADVLYRQMCLLPKHEYSADYVILCGSHFLQEYLEIEEIEEYTNSLRKMLSLELSKQKPSFKTFYTKAESALHTFEDRCKERNQKFHPVYTELAFLQLRSEEKYKDILPPHNLITLIIDRASIISSSSLQGNSINIGTAASLKKDAKAFYLAIFQILSCLFGKPELNICREAIENAHRVFKKNTNLGWLTEEAEELAERQNNHEKKRKSRERASARGSFFVPSSSSEEESFTKAFSKSVSKTTRTSIDSTELTEVLRALYHQNYARLPRLFSEEAEAIADTFVNVAILEEGLVQAKEKELDAVREEDEKLTNDKEMQDNRLQSHERLYEVHKPIAIGELFAPLSKLPSPKRILLYGRAGIGKTVLCQYVANQWAEKPDNIGCFKQFQAVFWIKLRELLDKLEGLRKRGRSIREEIMVAEMVTACCLRDSSWQKETKKQQLQIWLEKNAESTLFILDGYDEIMETAATQCELSDCLHVVLSQITYRPYVMLTSRPVAIHTRYGSFDRRLECMGFIDKNIPLFVKRYLKDVQQSSKCLTFLKRHPSIWGTAHIPLNLELLCWLWSSGELSADNCFTIAALYSQITTKMKEMNVDAQKHPNLIAKWQYADNQRSETTFADLAEEFFPFLGFHAMQQPGVLLKGRYIKQLLGIFIKKQDIHQKEGTALEDKQKKLLQACVDLSFLKSTQQRGKHLFDHTYYFIHLSFQEFFAAKYYQQAFERSDTAVIEHFRTHKYTPRYPLTWWMTAGLLYQHGNHADLKVFFRALCIEPQDLIGIHHANLLSHCLDECQADETIEFVARLVKHQATFLNRHLDEWQLISGWGATLLHCPNLLRAKSFQDIGLYLFEKPERIMFTHFHTAVFLSHLATQKAIACLAQGTIHSGSRANFAKALAKLQDLTPAQIESLFAFLTDTVMDNSVRKCLASALAQRPDLTSVQIESLFAFLTTDMMDSLAYIDFAAVLAERPNLTLGQIESLFAFLTGTAGSWAHIDFAAILAQRPDLTSAQIEFLVAFLTTDNGMRHIDFAKVLAQHPNLTLEQIASLFACLTTDTAMDNLVRIYLASGLARRPDLTPAQIASLFAFLKIDMTMKCSSVYILAEALAQCPNLTLEQIKFFFACLTDTAVDNRVRIYLALGFAQRPDLTPAQIASLFAFLTIDMTMMDSSVCRILIEALAQRPNLTLEQIEFLFSCLTSTTMSAPICRNLAQMLVQHLEQPLECFLQKGMIGKENPFLILSIVHAYYSTNAIEQQKRIVLSGLDTFLTRPSTWPVLVKKQALFLYDEVKEVALLRLDTQTIEIPLNLHPNPFLRFHRWVWGESLHPIEMEEIFGQKLEDYAPLQEIEHTLSGQTKKIVSTTTTPSFALASTMRLSQALKSLIDDSIGMTKKYCFQLKRVNAYRLIITFISSNESSFAKGRQLDALQKEMEACLQTANLNYACELKGRKEEILKVIGNKEVIDALADLLVQQGLDMKLEETNKYSSFFKAEKAPGMEDMSSALTCPMQ